MVDVKNSVSKEEWETRQDLAAFYRTIPYFGWDDLIFTHISAKVPGADDEFLINPYGFLFDEITASNLVKVNLKGKILSDTNNFINPAGFTIHSAIHESREDAHCIVHLHSNDGVAVASLKDGLLPLSQTGMLVRSQIAYHDYEGVALFEEEKERLVKDLGEARLMILRNHGTLALGKNVAEAFTNIYFLEKACSYQVRALSGNLELNYPSEESIETTRQQGEGREMAAALLWPAVKRKMERLDSSFLN
jgi:ribulose-5-phosphate 4-epimerase/fuculose-1-phosphate aldolase|uniref:Putative aldolase class II protein n=1 Tax=uncultured marine alpha proteobacterium HOT2C01 TaxID=248049 RepID=Q6UCQ3_9PROT|nr:putative aldolase class II protein [uncultured marine alpha proteobacterium HOT2C01]